MLVGAAWLIARAKIGSATGWTAGLLVVIGISSLGWSVYLSSADPGRAYFVTTTRMWELAVGGIAALALPYLRDIPRALAAAAGWLGFVGIFLTAFLLTADTPFPGYIALVPTISTAAILISGTSSGMLGPNSILDNAVVRWIGSCSYSLYLWHWPVLVIGGYMLTDGLREATVLEGVGLVLVSAIPAWLSLKYVENPARRWDALKSSTRNSLVAAFLGIALALIVGMLLALANPRVADTGYVSAYQIESDITGSSTSGIGAASLGDDPSISPDGIAVDSVAAIAPRAANAGNDNPRVYAGCHQEYMSTDAVACTWGDASGEKTVAIVGDSHAAHWTSALHVVARENNWKLLSYTKSSCPVIDAMVDRANQPYLECSSWYENVLTELCRFKKSAVFVSNLDYNSYGADGTLFASGSERVDAMASGMHRAWVQLQTITDSIIVLRDTPVSNFVVPDCVAAHEQNLTVCATPRSDAFGQQGVSQQAAAAMTPGVQLIDLNAWICPNDPCAAVIGGVIVYRDKTHMTATYSTSLASRLRLLISQFEPR